MSIDICTKLLILVLILKLFSEIRASSKKSVENKKKITKDELAESLKINRDPWLSEVWNKSKRFKEQKFQQKNFDIILLTLFEINLYSKDFNLIKHRYKRCSDCMKGIENKENDQNIIFVKIKNENKVIYVELENETTR